MSRDLGVQVGRYDEGLSVGHISAGALSLNPETGMAVGRRKRGAQSGQTIGPNGEVNDNFLNMMGSDGGVAVDNLHSHEMLHHMPDGSTQSVSRVRPPSSLPSQRFSGASTILRFRRNSSTRSSYRTQEVRSHYVKPCQMIRLLVHSLGNSLRHPVPCTS